MLAVLAGFGFLVLFTQSTIIESFFFNRVECSNQIWPVSCTLFLPTSDQCEFIIVFRLIFELAFRFLRGLVFKISSLCTIMSPQNAEI